MSQMPRSVVTRLAVTLGASTLADALLVVALTLMALDTGAGGTAAVLVAQAIPRAALLPWGGVLTDRFGALRVLRATAVVRAAMMTGLAIAAMAYPIPGLAVLLGVGVVLGIVDGAGYPAVFAAGPTVVPTDRLAGFNSIVSGIEGAGDLVGPALAAGLYAWSGPVVLIAAIAAVDLIAAVAAVGAAAAAPAPLARPAARPGLGEGLQVVRDDAELRRLLLGLAAVSLLLTGPAMVGGALLAEERFGGREQLGVILGAFGAGSLIGLVVAPRLARLRSRLVLPIGGLALGAGLVGVGAAPVLWVAALLAGAMGAVGGALGVVITTFLQTRTPEHVRGRVMALVAFALLALDPASLALAGLLVPFGAAVVLVVPGVAFLVLAILGLRPGVRRRAAV